MTVLDLVCADDSALPYSDEARRLLLQDNVIHGLWAILFIATAKESYRREPNLTMLFRAREEIGYGLVIETGRDYATRIGMVELTNINDLGLGEPKLYMLK